jgi:hypothetical protein
MGSWYIYGVRGHTLPNGIGFVSFRPGRACFLRASSGILKWRRYGRVPEGLDSHLVHGRQEFGSRDSGSGVMGFGCLEKLSEIKYPSGFGRTVPMLLVRDMCSGVCGNTTYGSLLLGAFVNASKKLRLQQTLLGMGKGARVRRA